jgi:hypothetical protein
MDFLYLFHAINFQKGFLLIAILILILTLLVVAYNAKYQAKQNWSPTVAPCPDYWDVSGAFCINTTGKNIGHGDDGIHTRYKNGVILTEKHSINDYNWVYNNSESCAGSDVYYYNHKNTNTKHYKCKNTDGTTLYVIPQETMSVKFGSAGHRRFGKTKNSRRNWAYKFGFMWDGLTSEIT